MRVYMSGDGGATWSSSVLYPAPSSFLASCASDPAVAIDRRGRQYYSFARTTPCRTGKPRLFVATRANASTSWRSPIAVGSLGGARGRQAGAGGRPVVVEPALRPSVRRLGTCLAGRVSARPARSWSDDGGQPGLHSAGSIRRVDELTYPSVAVSRTGVVYVAWDDAGARRLSIARSTDGGVRFGDARTVAAFSIVPIPHCGAGITMRAVRGQCLQANPIVSVDTSRGPLRGPGVRLIPQDVRRRSDWHLHRRPRFPASSRPVLRRCRGRERGGADSRFANDLTGPFLAGVGSRPVQRHALGLLLRDDPWPRAAESDVHVHRVAQRGTELRAAHASGLGGVGRDRAAADIPRVR